MNYRVRTLISFLEHNIHLHFTAEELAGSLGLSASRLQHLFKQETGMQITKFIREKRLEKAAHLLAHTFLSVKEIRAESGILDEGHFIQDFKEKYGMTPSAYRDEFFDFSEAEENIRIRVGVASKKRPEENQP